MLDLSKKVKKLWQIKMMDGKVLKIKPPTKTILDQLIAFKETDQKEDIEIIDDLYALVTDILNRNTNQITYSKQEIEESIDFEVAMEVLQEYLNDTIISLGK